MGSGMSDTSSPIKSNIIVAVQATGLIVISIGPDVSNPPTNL